MPPILDLLDAIAHETPAATQMSAWQLRQWRTRHRWTMEQAASMLGVQQGTISRWEASTRPIPRCIVYLARLLDDEQNQVWVQAMSEQKGEKSDTSE